MFSVVALTVTGGAGLTVRVTGTVITGPVDGVIVTAPLYVPTARVCTMLALSSRFTLPGALPLLGVPISQVPPVLVLKLA